MSGRQPSFRLSYKAKDGTRFDVGVAWESERFPGLFDLKPQKTNEQGQWPKMPLSEAARRVESGDGFLSISTPKPAQNRHGASPESRSGGTSYDRAPLPGGPDDIDVPF